MTHALVGDHVDRLIDNSLGSNWTRLYDSVSRHGFQDLIALTGKSVSVLFAVNFMTDSSREGRFVDDTSIDSGLVACPATS